MLVTYGLGLNNDAQQALIGFGLGLDDLADYDGGGVIPPDGPLEPAPIPGRGAGGFGGGAAGGVNPMGFGGHGGRNQGKIVLPPDKRIQEEDELLMEVIKQFLSKL